MKTISSRQNPIVRSIRALARDPDPTGTRLLLDGVHLVREARGSVAIDVVVVAASRLAQTSEEGTLALALQGTGVEVLAVGDRVFAAMSPVKTPSGIIALARRQPTVASAICAVPNAFVIAAADIQDPGNLGSLLRAAEAGGVTGVLVCGESANPFSWRALRGSMGSALRLPIAVAMSTDDAMTSMKQFRMRTIAAVARGGRRPDTVKWNGSVGLFVGGEGPGLSEDVIRRCDERVTIPMAPPVESLNVAAAAAIIVYEARRARE